MTATLGNFGTPREARTETFGYFGVEIRVHPDTSDLALLEFAELGSGLEEKSGQDALDAVNVVLRNIVHPDDFEEFWKLARKNRQTMDDMTDLAMAVIEAVTDLPTELPSDSSDGQSSTDTKSEVDSSSPVVRRLEKKGRPDLALMVTLAEEHGVAASG